MDNEELVFTLRAVATGLTASVNEATKSLEKVGNQYTQVDDKAKKAQQGTDGLSDAQKKQKAAASDSAAANQKLNSELTATAAVTAAAAAGFAVVTRTISAGIAAYNQYMSAMRGLQAVANSTGESMGNLTNMMAAVTDDGLIAPSDASAASKNLLLYGFSAEQTSDMLSRLKDVAVDNRQANYSLGEAVKVTTEGIRMENSILSDAAGVTKNIALMYEEYAQSLGVTTDSLTQAQKVQAVYTGVMQESEPFVGRASQYTKEFAGAQAELSANTQALQVALGDATSSGLTPFVSVLNGGAEGLTEFIENNRVLVSVVTTLITATLGLVAALGLKTAALKLLTVVAGTSAAGVTTLSGAFAALWKVIAPAAPVLVVLTALVATVAGIAAAAENAKKEAEELRQEIDALADSNKGAADLVSEYEQLENKTNRTAAETQRMLDIRAELVETYGFSVQAVDEEGRLLSGNLAIMKEQIEAANELLLLKLQESAAYNQSDWNAALDEREEKLERLARMQRVLSEPTFYDKTYSQYRDEDLEKMISDMELELQRLPASAQTAVDNTLQIMVNGIKEKGKAVPEAVQALAKDAMEALHFTGDTNFEEAGQSIIDRYLAIDEGVVETKVAEFQALREQIIAVLSAGDADAEDAAATANTLLDGIINDDTFAEAQARAETLRQRIADGISSPAEDSEFNGLMVQLSNMWEELQDKINDLDLDIDASALEDLNGAIDDTQKGYVDLASDIEKAAAEQRAANMTFEDARKELSSVSSAADNAVKAISDVADLKGAVEAISDYTDGLDQSTEAADNATLAREWLADQYGVEAEAIDGLLPMIDNDIAAKEALAQMEYILAAASAAQAVSTVAAMQDAGTVTAEQAAIMTQALQNVIDKMVELAGQEVTFTDDTGTTIASIKPNRTTYKGSSGSTAAKRSSGGGGSSSTTAASTKNEALDNELARIKHLRALDQLTTQEEIDNLNRVLAAHAHTTEERSDLIEQLYGLQKQKMTDAIDYQKAMDQLTLREEIERLDEVIATYKEGTEARKELEQRRYEAARDLTRQEYDLKVYYGQLTLADQEKMLKEMIASYKEGVQTRIDLEKELYDLQKSMREAQVTELDQLSDGVLSALEARYEAARKKEDDRLSESAKAWQEWGDAQTEAIQAQIDALDALTKSEDRSEQEAQKRREIAMLEQQLLYEKDEYNIRKLSEQIDQKKIDLSAWIASNERADLKDALQDQINAVKETVDLEQDKIEQQQELNDAYFDERVKQQNLQAEAEQLLLQGNQNDILNLLQSYASDYNATGQTLGQKLVDGFNSTIGNVDAWFDSFTSRFTEYQRQLASVATSAANNYYQAAGVTGSNPTGSTYDLTVYITGEAASSPSAVRQSLEQMLQDITNL